MECRGGHMGLGRVSLSADLVQFPRFWDHSVGRVKSCFLPPVSLQKRIPEQSPGYGRLENSTSGLDWGPRAMAIPMSGLLVQPQRGHT